MVLVYYVLSLFFFFKRKTAYDMRISDWSSDVCSSDLGDPVRGKREFLRCAICHSAEANVHKAGPSLATIYGRTAGTVESFTAYSEALSRAGIVWTEGTLDALLKDPAGYIPGRSEEHTSELQSLMRISYAVFCLKKK